MQQNRTTLSPPSNQQQQPQAQTRFLTSANTSFLNDFSNLNSNSNIQSPTLHSPSFDNQNKIEANPKTPDEIFQQSITSSLDRTLNSFKRSVIRDITQSFNRQYDSLSTNQIISTFADDFLQEIDQTIQSSPFYSIETASFSSKITSVFDENTKQIKRLFATSESTQINKKERKQEHLSDLNLALADLTKEYKDTTNNALDLITKIHSQIASKHDIENQQKRYNARKMRSLKIKRTDLESYLARQKAELDQAERLIKQNEVNIEEAMENLAKSNTKELNEKRIKQEIEEINTVLESNSINDFEDACYSVSQKIANLSNTMMEDLTEIDMLEQTAMIKIRNYLYYNNQQLTMRSANQSFIPQPQMPSFIRTITNDRKIGSPPGKNESLFVSFPE